MSETKQHPYEVIIVVNNEIVLDRTTVMATDNRQAEFKAVRLLDPVHDLDDIKVYARPFK